MQITNESEETLVARLGIYGLWLLKHGNQLPQHAACVQHLMDCYAGWWQNPTSVGDIMIMECVSRVADDLLWEAPFKNYASAWEDYVWFKIRQEWQGIWDSLPNNLLPSAKVRYVLQNSGAVNCYRGAADDALRFLAGRPEVTVKCVRDPNGYSLGNPNMPNRGCGSYEITANSWFFLVRRDPITPGTKGPLPFPSLQIVQDLALDVPFPWCAPCGSYHHPANLTCRGLTLGSEQAIAGW